MEVEVVELLKRVGEVCLDVYCQVEEVGVHLRDLDVELQARVDSTDPFDGCGE